MSNLGIVFKNKDKKGNVLGQTKMTSKFKK